MENFLEEMFAEAGLDWDEASGLFQHKQVAAKTTLLYEGDVSRNLYFIDKGALRLWNNDDGRDITCQFFFEGQLVSSFESFYLEVPSDFSIESLEALELMVLRKKDLLLLEQRWPAVNSLITKIISERFMEYTKYFLSRIKEKPEDRYRSLLWENPLVLERVPNYYVASYLGITAVSLSRIRKRIEKNDLN